MQRLTAKVLLLFALVGTFLPFALAATAPPPHACCLRKAHHCHEGTSSAKLEIRAASCCDHSCCHAGRISQSASALPANASILHQALEARVADPSSDRAHSMFFRSQSARAPPQPSMA